VIRRSHECYDLSLEFLFSMSSLGFLLVYVFKTQEIQSTA
jgi:hypothetical protein